MIGLDDAPAWSEAIEGLNCGFAYGRNYCRSLELAEGAEVRLYAYTAPELRVCCPLLQRPLPGGLGWDLTKPQGFSGFAASADGPQFAADFAAFASRAGFVCGYLALDPLAPRDLGFPRTAERSRGSIVVLDLTLSEPQLLAAMTGNRRRELQRPLPGELVTDRMELADTLASRYPDFMAAKGAAAHHRHGQAAIRALLAAPQVQLLGLRDASGLAAISAFACQAGIGEYLFHVPRPGDRGGQAAPLLWEGIRRSRAAGARRFNLGGSDRDDSLLAFKRRFGGVLMPLQGLALVFRPDAFERLCRAARQDPAADGYFPPYRAPPAS